jgi:exodeoxyribonuclease VII small subunit
VVKKAKQDEIPFEEALSELESLVETMEKGELSLEESLESFERGVALTRICQQALKTAEQKIEILTANSSDAELEPFQSD